MQGSCAQNFATIGPAVPEICGQTDRQTDGLITVLRIPYRGGVISFRLLA